MDNRITTTENYQLNNISLDDLSIILKLSENFLRIEDLLINLLLNEDNISDEIMNLLTKETALLTLTQAVLRILRITYEKKEGNLDEVVELYNRYIEGLYSKQDLEILLNEILEIGLENDYLRKENDYLTSSDLLSKLTGSRLQILLEMNNIFGALNPYMENDQSGLEYSQIYQKYAESLYHKNSFSSFYEAYEMKDLKEPLIKENNQIEKILIYDFKPEEFLDGDFIKISINHYSEPFELIFDKDNIPFYIYRDDEFKGGKSYCCVIITDGNYEISVNTSENSNHQAKIVLFKDNFEAPYTGLDLIDYNLTPDSRNEYTLQEFYCRNVFFPISSNVKNIETTSLMYSTGLESYEYTFSDQEQDYEKNSIENNDHEQEEDKISYPYRELSDRSFVINYALDGVICKDLELLLKIKSTDDNEPMRNIKVIETLTFENLSAFEEI